MEYTENETRLRSMLVRVSEGRCFTQAMLNAALVLAMWDEGSSKQSDNIFSVRNEILGIFTGDAGEKRILDTRSK